MEKEFSQRAQNLIQKIKGKKVTKEILPNASESFPVKKEIESFKSYSKSKTIII